MSESFAEHLERSQIRDEEAEKLREFLQDSLNESRIKRNLLIALTLYGSVGAVVVAAAAGLAVRVFVVVSGI